jgi:transposase-like protein
MASTLLKLISEEKCVEMVRLIRWPNGIKCPQCEAQSYTTDYEEFPKLQYTCKGCKKWWTDFSGTVFEGTRTPLKKWFFVLDLIRKGESANSIAEEAAINRKTVFRIRDILFEDLWLQKFGDYLSGEVEADEVYITCGEKGTKQKDRQPRKRGQKKEVAGAGKRTVLP